MSPPKRARRVSAALHETLADAVLRDLSDPRVEGVTITRVTATPDVKEARVWFTTRDPGAREAALDALEAARGVLQGRLSRDLSTRNTPILRFVYDEEQERAEALTRLIDEVAPPEDA